MNELVGRKLGSYTVESLLGAGGMGEVYVAVDERLGRKVALKVLAEGIAEDPDKRVRFEHEARAIAALNHPGIVTIHSIEEIDGIRFFTMELVEGQTLTEVMKKGRMDLRHILKIVIPLADAVGAAHAQGIAHRDLKPDNVIIAENGNVTVLDFGLAKLVESHQQDSANAFATTATLTTEGKIVGTVQYMSPEQAEGKPITPASDLFSLGVILYEMAAGERPFSGDSAIQLITAIIRDDPIPISRVNASMPAHLNRVLRRCLVKDPARRYQTAIELRNELEMLQEDLESGDLDAVPIPPPIARPRSQVTSPPTATYPSGVVPAPAAPSAAPMPEALPTRQRRGRLRPFLLGILLAVIAFLTLEFFVFDDAIPFTEASVEPKPHNWVFERHTEGAGLELDPALSPDGNMLAYTAKDEDGTFDIMLQRVGGRTAMNLTQSKLGDDSSPAFSPDSEQIAFISNTDGGGLYIMGATGESIRRVSDFGKRPSFSPNGKKLVVGTSGFTTPVSRTDVSELHIVDVETGDTKLLYEGDAVQPAWSPDGKYIAFWTLGPLKAITGQRDIGMINVDTGAVELLTDDLAIDWNPSWSADGRELFFGSNRGGTMAIWSMGFDPDSGRTTSEPILIPTPTEWAGPFTASAKDGAIAYVARNSHVRIRRIPADTESGSNGTTLIENYVLRGGFSISNDGKWITFQGGDLLREDIYIAQIDGSGMRQLTDDLHFDRAPAFSPDNEWVLFSSNRAGNYQVWVVRIDGSDLTQLTDFDERPVFRPRLSPDGVTLAAADMSGTALFDFQAALKGGPLKDDDATVIGGSTPSERRFYGSTWSPDGKRLLGWMGPGTDDPDGKIVPMLGELDVATQDFHPIPALDEDGTPFSAFNTPVYAADGKTVYVRTAEKIFKIDPTNGKSTVLVRDVVPLAMSDIAVTPDGKYIYFDEQVGESNIWISRPQE